MQTISVEGAAANIQVHDSGSASKATFGASGQTTTSHPQNTITTPYEYADGQEHTTRRNRTHMKQRDLTAQPVSISHPSYWLPSVPTSTKSINQEAAYLDAETGNVAPSEPLARNLAVDTLQRPSYEDRRQFFSPISAFEPGNSPIKGLFGSDFASVSFFTNCLEEN